LEEVVEAVEGIAHPLVAAGEAVPVGRWPLMAMPVQARFGIGSGW